MSLTRALSVVLAVWVSGCGGRTDVGDADAAGGTLPDGGPADAGAGADADPVLDWCDVTRGLVDGCDDAGEVTGATPLKSTIYCPSPYQCLYGQFGVHAWGCCSTEVCAYGDVRYPGCTAIQK